MARARKTSFIVLVASCWGLGCSSSVSLGGDNAPAALAQDAGVVDALSGPDRDVSTIDAAFDSCGTKACGVACTLCSPHDLGCVEPPGSKSCNPHHQCLTSEPLCP